MSSSISSSPGSSPVFFLGTQAQAKTEVKRLRNALLAREQSEPGSLSQEFVLLEQPSREEAAWHWSSRSWDQPGISSEKKEQAGVYVQSLLEAAYPTGDSLEMEMTHRGFASYLQRESHDEKLSSRLRAEELLCKIQDLHLVQLQKEAFEAGQKEGALPFAEDEPEKIEGYLLEFLQSKEVVPYFSQRLGEGNFGIVVSAEVKGEEGKYVYKMEKRDVSKALTERGSAFWREGDCAAARLNDISDLTRPLFFIFRTSQEGKPEELHYVPANHVKAFGMKLPPGATVFLEGQLMERATGENLDKIILRNPVILSPIKGKHFTNIVRGLFNIMEELQAHNLVHRDIKPENIFYNAQTGKVTLLDFGSAERLRKKEKSDHGAHLHKPTSTQVGGTLKYISPRVLQQKLYGSEADLFSFAMTVLELVNKNDFTSLAHKRFPGADEGDMKDVLFARCDATEYLDRFLDAVRDKESRPLSSSLPVESSISSLFNWSGSGNAQWSSSMPRSQTMTSSASQGSSKTENALNRNPEVKMVIDLAFQASEGGEKGAAAYEQLRRLPYFQPVSSPVTTDSPLTTSSTRRTDSPAVVGDSK